MTSPSNKEKQSKPLCLSSLAFDLAMCLEYDQYTDAALVHSCRLQGTVLQILVLGVRDTQKKLA